MYVSGYSARPIRYRRPHRGSVPAIRWLVVIVVAGIIGALLYRFVRRPQRIAAFGR